jgi:MFS family permease
MTNHKPVSVDVQTRSGWHPDGLAQSGMCPMDVTGTGAEWKAGWRAVLGAGLGTATGLSLFAYLTSLFIRHYASDFGWTRGEIAASAMGTLAAGLLAPLIGRLADIHGLRPVALASITGFSLTCVAMALQPGDIRVYWLLYFLLVFTGMGTGSITWARAVGNAFDIGRGLALSIALAFVTVTAAIMPPILQWVIDDHGWRAAWLVLGGLCFGAGVIGLLVLPAQPKPDPVLAKASMAPVARTPAFWLAVLGMFLINVPSGGIMNQMAALIADRGFDGDAAARVMSAFAVAVFVGRVVSGWCLDHFPARWVAFVSMAIPALGCLMLTSAGDALVAQAVLIGIVLAGLSQGAEGDVGPYVLARRFGLPAFGAMVGALGAATIAGTAAGAMLFGQTHDRTGTYDLALWIGAGCFLAGALCYLAIATSHPRRTAT